MGCVQIAPHWTHANSQRRRPVICTGPKTGIGPSRCYKIMNLARVMQRLLATRPSGGYEGSAARSRDNTWRANRRKYN